MAGGEIRSNTDTGLLKIVACVCMVIDHVGLVFFSGTPWYTPMRAVGRVAFPIFAYCIAVGCRYTRNIGLYALRLLLLGILVQPLYMPAMKHVPIGAFDWGSNFYRLDKIYDFFFSGRLNILFSLTAGVLILWTLRDKKYILTALVCLGCYLIESRLDYGLKGLLLMVLFYAFLDRPITSLVWVGLLMVHWGMPSLFGQWNTRHVLQIYALTALPLIYAPIHTRLRLNKFFFYAFYPGHLLVIYLIQRFM